MEGGYKQDAPDEDGMKRNGSGARPGKAKRRKMKELKGTPTVEAAAGGPLAQPSAGSSKEGNEPGEPVSSPQQEEEVVVVEVEEEAGSVSVGRGEQAEAGAGVPVPDCSLRRLRAVLNRVRGERPRVLDTMRLLRDRLR